MEMDIARDYQLGVVNEGYQPKGEKIDPKDLKPPKGGTAAFSPIPQMIESEKK